MNRGLFTATVVFGSSSLLLVDSAIKGGAILLLAALFALALRRDSAAKRHLVWLVAIVAILGIPVFSAALPQWRVLPAWAVISHESPATESRDVELAAPAIPMPEQSHAPSASQVFPIENKRPFATENQTVADVTALPIPVVAADTTTPLQLSTVDTTAPNAPHGHWAGALPLVWAIGCCMLLLRLLAARFMLWSKERRGNVMGLSGRSIGFKTRRAAGLSVWSDSENVGKDCLADEVDSRIVAAFDAARRELGIRRQVVLLLHSDRTIPVVWGVIRLRLLLPDAARQWSDEQLRSVLLHELAHIKRHDTVAQLLAQFACALHWFNPLVWFAAWRLHVERERACDDLVLGMGVRASAYAEHLLNVATRLSSSPWTQACGLAMARSSSLDGRVRAVLCQNRNRHSVTATFAAIALLLGIGTVIPVAMLRAAEEEATVFQEEDQSKPANGEKLDDPEPKHQNAKELFKQWQANARLNGKIPGGRLRSLAKATSSFVEYNPTDERAPKLAELLKRMDVTRDWTQQEAVDLLNDVTDVYENLPTWASDVPRFSIADDLRRGQPLPDDLKNAPWGDPQPNGLRVAWLLGPQSPEHRLNTPLKSRLLYHNSGKETVVFRVVTWNQSGAHKARDADGKDIDILATEWTTIGQVSACRLHPGEFTEVVGAGIGVGPRLNQEDWRNTRVGAWIHAKAGDQVTFTPDSITVSGDDGRQKEVTDTEWWSSFITHRLERDAPIPDAADERKRLLERAMVDLFGTLPTPEEAATFLADKSPEALKALVKRLVKREGTAAVSGKLRSGTTTFRVLPIDPDAKNKPRLAIGPGRYELGDNVRLVIVGRGDVMDAKLEFSSDGAPIKSHEIKLPNKRGTWAIAWKRDVTTLWIGEEGKLRSVDFTNPAEVKEAHVNSSDTSKVPARFLEALRPTFERKPQPPPPAAAKR